MLTTTANNNSNSTTIEETIYSPFAYKKVTLHVTPEERCPHCNKILVERKIDIPTTITIKGHY